MSAYKIGLHRGSNGGQAIYLTDDNGGFRLFGPKCWGMIRPVVEFCVTMRGLDDAIAELQRVRDEMTVALAHPSAPASQEKGARHD